jgi:hypothetical protein
MKDRPGQHEGDMTYVTVKLKSLADDLIYFSPSVI